LKQPTIHSEAISKKSPPPVAGGDDFEQKVELIKSSDSLLMKPKSEKSHNLSAVTVGQKPGGIKEDSIIPLEQSIDDIIIESQQSFQPQ